MNNNRKTYLKKYANAYASEFKNSDGIPNLTAIAESEDITIIYDHYERSFGGLTVYEDGRFFIHLDLDSTKDKNNGRARFTLAHELGHALIDEHRLGLMTGKLESHVSEYLLGVNDKKIELEADFFASCLLMPSNDFKNVARSFSNFFSVDVLRHLASHFRTSLLATIFRFVDVGIESVFITFNQSERVKWFAKSNDFPDWAFKFKVGQMTPENTVVGDYFRDKKEKYSEVEEVDRDDWFYVSTDHNAELNLYEQCIYIEDYDYVISVLWFSK